MAELDRLRWRCRRGMLELDLVLTAFLARHAERLDAGERRSFAELLEYSDNDLLDLVMGRAEPVEQGHVALLGLIRAAGAGSGQISK